MSQRISPTFYAHKEQILKSEEEQNTYMRNQRRENAWTLWTSMDKSLKRPAKDGASGQNSPQQSYPMACSLTEMRGQPMIEVNTPADPLVPAGLSSVRSTPHTRLSLPSPLTFETYVGDRASNLIPTSIKRETYYESHLTPSKSSSRPARLPANADLVARWSPAMATQVERSRRRRRGRRGQTHDLERRHQFLV